MFAFILLSCCTERFSVSEMHSSVIHSKKRDVAWFWPLWKPEMSGINYQFPFCQDCFSFAWMCTPSSWISGVGSEYSRWAKDISQLFFWGWVEKMIWGSTIITRVHQSVILRLLSKIYFALFCQKCICYICHLTWQTPMPHLNKIGIINSRMTGEGKLKTKQNTKAEQFRSSSKPSLLWHFFPSLHNKQSKPKSQIQWEVSLFAVPVTDPSSSP